MITMMSRLAFIASLAATPLIFLGGCSNKQVFQDQVISNETFDSQDIDFKHNVTLINCIFKNCRIKIGDRVHFDQCVLLESHYDFHGIGGSMKNSYIRYTKEFVK